jgi:septal ring factor EnvC (AmiA/AmiB activator)
MLRFLQYAYITFFVIFFIDISVIAQNRKYYESLKSNKKTSIEYSKKLLKDLQSTHENNLDMLLITREQIKKQKEILNIVEKEMILIDDEIRADEDRIVSLKEEKDNVIAEYTKLIVFSYRNLDLQRKMIFIFSAGDFNKAYKRMIYLKNLSDYRKSRFLKIEENIAESDSVIKVLSTKKNEKKYLQAEKKSLIDSLEIRRKQLSNFVVKNNSEINKVMSQIDSENKRKEETKINVTRKIQKEEENKPIVVKNKSSKLDKKVDSNFEAKKGWHIWPLSKFVILHHFGDYSHPVFENVQVKNDGVELGASPGSNVHAIFEGSVIDVVDIPGDGASIIIKHGDFYSVYSKMRQILIKPGVHVTKGQVIARLGKSEKLEKMNFQLWKGKNKLNPEVWLKKQ